MMSRIMDRIQGRPGVTLSLILGLSLLAPTRTLADKISSSDTAKALHEAARASALPLSDTSLVAILNAGTPVSETITTTYGDGRTQTANLTIAPDKSNDTVTTTKLISLANGKLEKVVDVATIAGNSTMSVLTTTLPNGAIETKNETEVTNGDKTTITGTVSMPHGGTQTLSGDTVLRGSQSITTLAITNPAGQVYNDRITITHDGDLSQSETNTTRGPDGSIWTVKSTSTTVLDPSGTGQTAVPANLNLPAASVPAQALNLEAQVLANTAGSSNSDSSSLVVSAPEPSTLMFYALVLGAAGLRYGFKPRRS